MIGLSWWNESNNMIILLVSFAKKFNIEILHYINLRVLKINVMN